MFPLAIPFHRDVMAGNKALEVPLGIGTSTGGFLEIGSIATAAGTKAASVVSLKYG